MMRELTEALAISEQSGPSQAPHLSMLLSTSAIHYKISPGLLRIGHRWAHLESNSSALGESTECLSYRTPVPLSLTHEDLNRQLVINVQAKITHSRGSPIIGRYDDRDRFGWCTIVETSDDSIDVMRTGSKIRGGDIELDKLCCSLSPCWGCFTSGSGRVYQNTVHVNLDLTAFWPVVNGTAEVDVSS